MNLFLFYQFYVTYIEYLVILTACLSFFFFKLLYLLNNNYLKQWINNLYKYKWDFILIIQNIHKLYTGIYIYSIVNLFKIGLLDLLYWLYKSQTIEIVYSILVIVLGSAYLSLLERQVVAVLQQRFGPSLTGGIGALIQPLADGFKLLTKEIIIPSKSKVFLYLLAPLYTFSITISIWAFLPISSNPYFFLINKELTLLFIIILLVFTSYGPIFGGWASNNKYALLGAYRAVALSGSYGITIGLALLIPAMCAQSFNLLSIVLEQENLWFILPSLDGSILMWIIMLTEIKKVPFDVSESEAELSSGYLIEYSGFNFALFIIAEYASIHFSASLFILSFLGGWLPPKTTVHYLIHVFLSMFNEMWSVLNLCPEYIIFVFKLSCMLLFYMIVRSILPNYRFDYIMILHWKYIFPFLLNVIILDIIIS